jgi:hypothetical protein
VKNTRHRDSAPTPHTAEVSTILDIFQNDQSTCIMLGILSLAFISFILYEKYKLMMVTV